MSWFGDFASNFIDPLHIFIPSGAQERNEGRQDEALKLQKTALEHQMNFDEWSKGFAQQQFETQKDLAYNSPAIGLKSVGSMGVNPIVASGASAGSVGVSSPSSSADSPNSTSPVSNQTGVGSLLGIVGSLIGTKMQGNTQKDIVEKELASNEKIAGMQDATRNRELDIQEEHNLNESEYWQGLLKNAQQGLRIQEGQLALEKQKRLDQLVDDMEKRSRGTRALELQYEELELKKKELERAIKADNKQLIGKCLTGLCVIAASILGGPAAGVTAGAIANFITSGRPIGFNTGK